LLGNYQLFPKNHHLKDINTHNPIGTKGILAREYGNLLNHMWYGENNVVSPWNFKRAIAKFQPMVI
jgi:ubiquitin C-terminal hydrolase